MTTQTSVTGEAVFAALKGHPRPHRLGCGGNQADLERLGWYTAIKPLAEALPDIFADQLEAPVTPEGLIKAARTTTKWSITHAPQQVIQGTLSLKNVIGLDIQYWHKGLKELDATGKALTAALRMGNIAPAEAMRLYHRADDNVMAAFEAGTLPVGQAMLLQPSLFLLFPEERAYTAPATTADQVWDAFLEDPRIVPLTQNEAGRKLIDRYAELVRGLPSLLDQHSETSLGGGRELNDNIGYYSYLAMKLELVRHLIDTNNALLAVLPWAHAQLQDLDDEAFEQRLTELTAEATKLVTDAAFDIADSAGYALRGPGPGEKGRFSGLEHDKLIKTFGEPLVAIRALSFNQVLRRRPAQLLLVNLESRR